MTGDARRRVALVTSAAEAGGAERLIETLAERLPRHRVRPVLAAPENSALLQSWQDAGYETIALPPFGRLRRIAHGLRIVAEIVTRLRDARLDVVHTHGVSAQLHAGVAARRLRLPVVYHAHDVFDADWSTDGALQRLALRVPAGRIIAISATVAASLSGRVPTGELETILNGVAREPVAPAPDAPAGPLVVWCGRLQHWKGPHHFVAAAAAVAATRPAVRFALVGGTLFGLEPDFVDALREQATAAGLDDRLTFVGHVRDARPWLRAADIVVHSADRPEPFGLVMAEAMMQERPVVAFRHGGAAEIVLDGQTGRLVPPRDIPALAGAIGALLDDLPEARAMGAAGRQRALRYFDAERMTAAVAAVYDAVRDASGPHV
jgi:glycosyltransferase involved in cell wall biosynthesis